MADAFWNIMLGYFFGFALGVGCALAVMYTIWTGGYKRAVEHSLMPDPPERFRTLREAAQRKLSRFHKSSEISNSR